MKYIYNFYTYVITVVLLVSVQGIIHTTEFKLGIENIDEALIKRFAKKRIGIITNQTGLDQYGRSTIDILLKKGFNVVYLFAPEHGITGMVGAGQVVNNSVDQKTNIPVVSLYGHGSGRMIPVNVLNDIDAIMFDVQDSGMRHYTYISTLFHAMKMAVNNDKAIIVFDRPNPLGVNMEGPVVESHLKSFISIASIPLRHGMTIGELAWYFNTHELPKPAKLHVVKMKQYDRALGLNNQLLAPLSPGLRTMQACYGYSFLGLLGEIGPFGIGLRTDARFQCIVLPKKITMPHNIWKRLLVQLKKCGIDSVFHSYVDPKSKREFKGVRLHIKDINKVQSFNALYATLKLFKSVGLPLSFSRDFDYAVGTSIFRKLLQGSENFEVLGMQVNTRLVEFFQKARDTFMYNPLPVPILIK